MKARDLGVRLECGGECGDCASDAEEAIAGQARRREGEHIGERAGAQSRPSGFEPIGVVDAVGLGAIESGFEGGVHRCALGGGHACAQAIGGERGVIKHMHRIARVDRSIHGGLCEARFVDLVVAGPPIADEIDHDVALEGGAPVRSDLGGAPDGFGVIAVDVQDGRFDQSGDVDGRPRAAALFRQCGEAELVVDDDVNRAAQVERGHARQLQHFRNEALAGKARIRMQEQGQNLSVPAMPTSRLFGARTALRNDRRQLQMRGMR